MIPPGQTPLPWAEVNAELTPFLKADFPEVRSATRLFAPARRPCAAAQVAAVETMYWADPNLFDVLPLPVLAGDSRRPSLSRTEWC